MSMVVKNNLPANRTLNTLNKNSSALSKSLAKVSSGQKINSAQDDASAYVISEKMREQIRSLEQDDRNIQNAGSLLKTAEGAVNSTVEILRTIKEKAVNAATDTNTDKDRAVIQKEIDQFIDQIDDNALITFNGKRLLDGSTVETTLLDPNSSSSSTLDEDARAAIIKGLSSEWVQAALNLVDESFGLGWNTTNGANAGVKEITVHLDEEDSSALAWVTNYSYTGDKAFKLELHVNMKYYDDIDMTNENGATKNSNGAMYLDRTLAHEFTHAAMAANITDFNQLPKWFKEGSAELSHGADDARAVTMVSLLQDPTTLQAVLNGSNEERR